MPALSNVAKDALDWWWGALGDDLEKTRETLWDDFKKGIIGSVFNPVDLSLRLEMSWRTSPRRTQVEFIAKLSYF